MDDAYNVSEGLRRLAREIGNDTHNALTKDREERTMLCIGCGTGMYTDRAHRYCKKCTKKMGLEDTRKRVHKSALDGYPDTFDDGSDD
ncbi:MAG: hypothetical protein ISS36_02810 [Candidatus Aenigmarchaeota archaeon]|nr:hypothetical protein [Candidatus Aenigmarchaeota archaeon]